MLLQRQLLARLDHDPLHPEAVAAGPWSGTSPRADGPARAFGPPSSPSASSSATRALTSCDRSIGRDQQRVGGVDDGEAIDPEHAQQPAVGAQVAVVDVAGQHPALAGDALARRAGSAPRPPSSRRCRTSRSSPARTAPRLVRSITAWSKADLRRAERTPAPSPKRAEVDRRPRRLPARTAASASGACTFDLAEAGVGAEAEYPRVPEAAFGDQPRGRAPRPASRRSGRPRVPPADRLAARDVAEAVEGPVGVDAEHDDPRRPAPARPPAIAA